MTKSKLLGASGRFGVRYGQSAKRRITEIERKQRKKQACPFCNGRAIRIFKGIWACKRCGKKFAGHAYFLEKEYIRQELNKEMPKGLKKEKATENKELKIKKTSRKTNSTGEKA